MNYRDLNSEGNIHVFLDISIDDIKLSYNAARAGEIPCGPEPSDAHWSICHFEWWRKPAGPYGMTTLPSPHVPTAWLCPPLSHISRPTRDLASSSRGGRVIVELFKNHVPKTAENFRALCTGEKGIGGLKVPLHYKNSIFHKAVPECIVQGGDITNNDGTGGESIYGPYFEDESLEISHSESGLLSMANCGLPHTNNSQFCITLGQASHLDGAYVVFGRVVKGFNIINDISYQPLHPNYMPIPMCKISDCGELQPGQDWGYCDQDFTDVYPPYPEDWEPPLRSSLQVNDIVKVVTNIKDAGNKLLKQGDNIYAYQKYMKCVRYLNWLVSQKLCDRDQTTAVRTQVRLNAALVCLRLGYFREAIDHCNEVPDMATNVKALFRRALAREGLNDHIEALQDLDIALQISPTEPAVLAEVSRINRFLSRYQAAERRWCSRIFRT